MPRENFLRDIEAPIVTAQSAAELSEFPVTSSDGHPYPSGTLAFLIPAKRYLTLDRDSMLAPNGTTIIDANGAGNWIEDGAALAGQTAFFVNSATGNDNNDGLTALTAVQTISELSSRLTDVVFRQNVTINLSGSFATEDIVVTWSAIEGASVALVGTPTLILQGTFTAKQDMNIPAATDGTVTDAAIPVSWQASGAVDAAAARGSFLIRHVLAGATVSSTFTLQDLGAKVCAVGQWVTTLDDPFQDPSTKLETTVNIGNAYRVDSLTRVGDIIVEHAGTNVISQWLDHRAVGARPLKMANAASNRGITLNMSSIGSDVFVEGTGSLNHFTACYQQGSSGIMVSEWNGFGIVFRGPSGVSTTMRFFGCGGVGMPGNLVLQSCGIVCDNGTAIGFANVLARGLTAGVPAIKLQTNSRCKFANISAPAAAVSADVGIETGSGCIAVLSGGVAGSFTTGASRICGTIVPNAKLGAASYDLTHLSGVILENGIGAVKVFGFVSTTVARPTVGISVGTHGFDTTLGIPIWYNGAAWVDATGAVV